MLPPTTVMLGAPGAGRMAGGRGMCYWPSMPGWRGRVCGGVVSWSLSHDVCVWDWRGSCLCISLCVLYVCVRVCILLSL